MNITLRPSGGRGEYELAGTQGQIHINDLYEMPMFIEILPSIKIDAHSKCLLRDGKPRIRLTTKARNAHPSSLIAAAMMLPKPRRDRHETHGENLLLWEQFVVQTIRINVTPSADGVLISPVTVRLENGDGRQLDFSFADRMSRVLKVWIAAAGGNDAISTAVRAHESAFTSATSTQTQLTQSFTRLHAAMGTPDSDMLSLLEAHFGLSFLPSMSLEVSGEFPEENFAENVHINPAEARVERVRKWRLAVIRGSSAATFRNNVRNAYDSRCMFSGQRLPRTESTSRAGVDAAHILPWSRYDLDATKNGLCLNKQCHWAFDEGLFRLKFDETENVYVVSIPDPVRLAAQTAHFDLESFDALVGPIPRERLPTSEAFWPSSSYLDVLNGFLDDEAA